MSTIPSNGCAPCSTPVCNTCPTPNLGYTTDPVNGGYINPYTVGDIINIHCNEGYRIYDLMCNDFNVSYMATLLFDTQRGPDGTWNLMPKSIPGLQQTLTNDGVSIKRGERDMKLDEATITAGGVSNDIPTSRTDFVLEGEVVRILTCDPGNCCQGEEIRKVVSIVPNVSITVDGAPITFFANNPLTDCNNKVIRLYETYNLCSTVLGRQILDPITDKHSFFQHIGDTICFDKAEMNTCYAVAGGPVQYVNEHLQAMRNRIFQTIQNIFWFGRNKQVATNITNDGPETMGVITGIQDAQARFGVTLTRDVSCLKSQDEKLAALMDELRKASECGIGSDREIHMVGNTQAIQALMMMGAAWNRLLGCVPTCANTGMKTFQPYTIKTPFGSTVYFYPDSSLTRHYRNQSILVFIPKEWISMYTYQNAMNNMGQITKAPSTIMQRKDITHLQDAKFDCGNCYKVTGSFANIMVGLGTGRWRILYGL